jgi:poly(3-hydroxybutyrate) depolymerase
VILALPPNGVIGSWLVAGPLQRGRGPDDASLVPRLDKPLAGDAGAPVWRMATSHAGVLDLAAALDVRAGPPCLALAGGVLHVDRPGKHVLLLGVDDAVTVLVDGKRVFEREQARVRRDDEDLVELDLSAGKHVLVLALQRFGRHWGLRARILDATSNAPVGGWSLPGTNAVEARDAAPEMVKVSLDRGVGPADYRPTLTVGLGEGFPLGVALEVRARLVPAGGGHDPVFDVDIGRISGRPNDPFPPAPLSLPTLRAAEVEDHDWTVQVVLGARTVDFPFHPRRAVREALEHTTVALASAGSASGASTESLESVSFLRDRLASFAARGDGDVSAQLNDARELDELSTWLDQGVDPYVPNSADGGREPGDVRRRWRTGPMRRAYRSPVDGHPSEFAVYVPPDFDPKRTYPLIVALHGMNGYPMQMLMWLFGHDDPTHDGAWEDRHPLRDLEPLEAVVVAPDGHFNSMYRELGEDDVMRVVDWAIATYPIDPARVSVTGPSMGGIGAAACALHHPDRFAAAEPLCGYQSYFVRSDIAGRSLRPWERFIAERRSNVFWAENGLHIPLYIVHGTKDLPEENSGVLIDRYEELHYDVEHEHPDLGHNVWQPTYEDLKGARWLVAHRRPLHPRAVRFKTPSTRWADDAWVHVRELASSVSWGEISASVEGQNTIFAATRDVRALTFDRDPKLVDDTLPVTVNIDGNKVAFQAGEPLDLHQIPAAEGGKALWKAGSGVHEGPFKHGAVTGPIRDVFHEPILFVWGASDPAQARANEEVAHAWATVRWGVRVDYPVLSDDQFFERGEPLGNDRALFLVGNAESNRVTRELEPDFPIRIQDGSVLVGATSFPPKKDEGAPAQLGVVFIRPNPRRPDRYVVVVEGVSALGTWRSLSLPDMLPDYAVYDEQVTAARGELVLGAGTLRAGGFFGQDWSLSH